MARMSRMDAAFLAMERPNLPGHLGTVMFFQPNDEGPLTYDTVLETVAERLPLVPSARRVVADVPFGLARPSWEPDRAFDLTYHVRHTAVPKRGGEAALARVDRPHPRHPARPGPPAVGAVGHRGDAR